MMPDPQSTTQPDPARRRFFVIALIRLSGALMVTIGMLTVSDVIAIPRMLGYVLIVIGLIDLFVFPQILVRRWRTPR